MAVCPLGNPLGDEMGWNILSTVQVKLARPLFPLSHGPWITALDTTYYLSSAAVSSQPRIGIILVAISSQSCGQPAEMRAFKRRQFLRHLLDHCQYPIAGWMVSYSCSTIIIIISGHQRRTMICFMRQYFMPEEISSFSFILMAHPILSIF